MTVGARTELVVTASGRCAAVLGSLLLSCSVLQAADSRPAFCAPVPDSVLGGLAVPYARKVAPDGSVYCEGLLRAPIALPPPRVVSLKQQQDVKPGFSAGSTAVLNWCDESQAQVQI